MQTLIVLSCIGGWIFLGTIAATTLHHRNKRKCSGGPTHRYCDHSFAFLLIPTGMFGVIALLAMWIVDAISSEKDDLSTLEKKLKESEAALAATKAKLADTISSNAQLREDLDAAEAKLKWADEPIVGRVTQNPGDLR